MSLEHEFSRRGVSIIVLSFAEPVTLARYQEYHKWPFAVLADPGRCLYEAFALRRLSLWRVFSPATLRLYAQMLWRGSHIQDYGKEDFYQSGGDFLIDRNGSVLFAYCSREPADRPSPARLVQEIDRIQSGRLAAGAP